MIKRNYRNELHNNALLSDFLKSQQRNFFKRIVKN